MSDLSAPFFVPRPPLRVLMGILLLLSFGFLQDANGQKNKRKELNTQVRLMERSSGFSPRDTAYVDLVNKLAGEMRFYNADSLHQLAEKALNISQESGYPRGASISNMHLAHYYSDRGNSETAIAHFREGLKLAAEIQDDPLYLSMLNYISGEYEYQGDYARALNGYLTALERAE
ncbi:MAG: tetratricopeptide repeat protein, partial [Robiginitalea sp.]|nr:tetratricopeptide repeat protein [Robiginitalea sp.]